LQGKEKLVLATALSEPLLFEVSSEWMNDLVYVYFESPAARPSLALSA
jgi:hypothetical protein